MVASSKVSAIFFLVLYVVLLYFTFFTNNGMVAMAIMAVGMFLEACEGVYCNFFKRH